MKAINNTTPVLILSCRIGGLSIMRSLGSLGVAVYGIDAKKSSPALKSKYCTAWFLKEYDRNNEHDYLDYIINIANNEIINKSDKKIILIPTSDELSIFAAKYIEELSPYFIYPGNSAALMDDLADKRKMFGIATKHNVPVPHTSFPQNVNDVAETADKIMFPVMLKAIDGQVMHARYGKKMVIVSNKEELIENYKSLEDPVTPNTMIQELIPGDDDQVYIYNGYFNKDSDALISFTGHKIRQFPVHVGCASLGECRWHQRVADKTRALMKAVGYQGILDIGYRLDPRDNKYKVLDINPRVGQAFRLFLAENGMDVIRSLYLDLTGQPQQESKPREGRRWLIEDYDIVSSLNYYKEGSLGFFEWLRSYRGVEEAAWFSWKDPKPFLVVATRFTKKALFWIYKTIISSIPFVNKTLKAHN